MKTDVAPFYQTPELGNKVTVYAAQHSTPLPKHITDYHAECYEHEMAIMLTSDFQSQLHLFLAGSVEAKRVLEIGVFLGYSAMVWAHAVGPDGLVTGLEYSAEYAEMARKGLSKHGVQNVEIVVGPAAETLKQLSFNEPYDLVFIDADKESYSGYLTELLSSSQPGAPRRLLRPGALILVDNVLQGGDVADEDPTREAERTEARRKRLEVVRAFNEQCIAEPRLQAFLVPLWDGLSVMRLLD